MAALLRTQTRSRYAGTVLLGPSASTAMEMEFLCLGCTRAMPRTHGTGGASPKQRVRAEGYGLLVDEYFPAGFLD